MPNEWKVETRNGCCQVVKERFVIAKTISMLNALEIAKGLNEAEKDKSPMTRVACPRCGSAMTVGQPCELCGRSLAGTIGGEDHWSGRMYGVYMADGDGLDPVCMWPTKERAEAWVVFQPERPGTYCVCRADIYALVYNNGGYDPKPEFEDFAPEARCP